MEHVADKVQFSEVAVAAPSIFAYVEATPVLQGHTLDFEYGMVDRPSARALAKFGCVQCTTCRKSVVWVTAITQLDGSWDVSHTISWVD